MKQFRVDFVATASASVVVCAEDRDQAGELALKQFPYPSPCAIEDFDLGEWEVSDHEWGIEQVDEGDQL